MATFPHNVLAAGLQQAGVLAAGERLALTRHLRPRLVPGEAPPAAAVAARRVQMSAEELGRRWRARLAAEG